MNRLVLFLFLSFLFCDDVLLKIDNKPIYSSVFFQNIPRSSWVELDSLKKERVLDDFIKKEMVYSYSLQQRFDKEPEAYIKLKNREKQLLVNAFYEREVAFPLIDNNYLLETKKHLFDRVYVYHILFGFKESSLNLPLENSKEEALLLAQKTKKQIQDSLILVDFDNRDAVFGSFALSVSNDPSVSQNQGEIGWVSWGQVMPSFQRVAFSLPVLTVSDPVLTDFGYHLVFVKKRGLSDYYYYNKEYAHDLSFKFGLQGVPTDSLRFAASAHDSLYIEKNSFSVNFKHLGLIMDKIHQKTKVERLRGGKTLYIEWLKEIKEKDILFVFKNKGYGVGWFINKMSKTPATRITTIKNKEDFVFLLKSFLIQSGAVELGYQKGLHKAPVFKEELLQQSKNILFKNYEKFLLAGVNDIDSSSVSNLYEKGVYRGDYIKPKQVVFSEIRVDSRAFADSILSVFSSSGDFDALKKEFNGKLKKPISEGGGGPLGEVAFSLSAGEVSGVVENPNRTFSVIRVEKYIEEEPFSLDRVYSQIERKIKKGIQDSLKKNIGEGLYDKFSLYINREVLSF